MQIVTYKGDLRATFKELIEADEYLDKLEDDLLDRYSNEYKILIHALINYHDGIDRVIYHKGRRKPNLGCYERYLVYE